MILPAGAAFGALAAGVPDALATIGLDRLAVLRGMFALYGGCGLLVWLLYRRLPEPPPHERAPPGRFSSGPAC